MGLVYFTIQHEQQSFPTVRDAFSPPPSRQFSVMYHVQIISNHRKEFYTRFLVTFHFYWGRGNSAVVSVSVYQAGGPGSLPARSACFRKVEFCHCVIDSLPPVLMTGSKKAVHVLLCLCNNACKRFLAICRKSRALCPVSRLLSVPI